MSGDDMLPRSMTLIAKYGSLFFTAALSLFVLYGGLVTPENNWDVVPYIASAHALTEPDAQKVHAWTFAELAEDAGTRVYTVPEVQADSVFRERMRTDPAAFSDILRFYQVRILYTFLILLLSTAGFNAVTVTHLLSSASIVGTLWVVHSIGRGRWPLPVRMAVPMLFLFMGGLAAAKLSTPDALALFLLVLMLRAWLQPDASFVLLLPLLVLIRTDLLLLVLCVGAVQYIAFPSERKRIILAVAAAAALMLFLHWYLRYPGWGTAFSFTFISRTGLLEQPAMGSHNYLPVLTKGITILVISKKFLLYCAMVYASLWMLRRMTDAGRIRSLLQSIPALFLTASLSYLLLRMLLFPMAELRFLVIPYAVGIIACAESISLWWKADRTSA